MAKIKVCLVTGAAGAAGQKIISGLVAAGKKVLALAEPEELSGFDVLNKGHIRVTTALPVTAASFKKHEVQFCFGDVKDISFLASIFASAKENGIMIEYAVYLSANAVLQKSSPSAYHPDFAAAANMIEVASSYWQSNKDIFKGFFYASNADKTSLKTENMINRLVEKVHFPAIIHKPEENFNIAEGYHGKTPLKLLYRLFSPLGAPVAPIKENNTLSYNDAEEVYIKSLSRAVIRMVGKSLNNE